MKKILVIIIGIVLCIISPFNVKANSNDKVLIKREDGISITYNDFEKLCQYGITIDELKDMDIDRLNQFLSQNIISSNVMEKNIETKQIIENDFVIEEKVRELNRNEFDYLVKKDKMAINTRGNQSDSKSEINEYKRFYLYVVYYENNGTDNEFYARTTMEWVKVPDKRYKDIISLAFTNNLQIMGKYYPSHGQNYLDLYSEFTYKTHNYSTMQDYGYNYISDYKKTVNGTQTWDYNYDFHKAYLGIEYEMPVDTQGNYTDGWDRPFYMSRRNYEFKFLLETRLIPLQQGIRSASVLGWHAHQSGSGKINWGRVTVKPFAPFFSYSGAWWQNDPNFDKGIGGVVTLNNL